MFEAQVFGITGGFCVSVYDEEGERVETFEFPNTPEGELEAEGFAKGYNAACQRAARKPS